MSRSNKDFVRQAQEILSAQGHTVSLGHVYELFSRLSGFNDWNTAKANNVEFKVVALSEESEDEKVVAAYIKQNAEENERLKDCAIVSLTLQASATVLYQNDYVLKPGVEASDSAIEQLKARFVRDISELKIDEVRVMEPPVSPHDYDGTADVEVDEITTHSERLKLEESAIMIPGLERYKYLAKAKELENLEKSFRKA